jgi:hypothetical protein
MSNANRIRFLVVTTHRRLASIDMAEFLAIERTISVRVIRRVKSNRSDLRLSRRIELSMFGTQAGMDYRVEITGWP